jgi:putative phosphoesterase
MTRIGLLSDTHGFMPPELWTYFTEVDEVWHAGDFGNRDLIDEIRAHKPFRGVWGNIDGPAIRHEIPEIAEFQIEDLRVSMIHIGGYPGKYTKAAAESLDRFKPGLFISGHSHILKVIFDPKRDCLHINPGAAGQQGWHQMRTFVRFNIDGSKITNCEVIELGKRGALH